MRSTIVLAGVVVAVPLLALACGAPSRPVLSEPLPSATIAAPATFPAPRWVRTGGVTQVGPKLPSGRMLIVGGRLALLSPSGALKLGSAEPGYAVLDALEVSTKEGARIFVRGEREIHSMTHPLGNPTPFVRTSSPIAKWAAFPSELWVWTTAGGPPVRVDAVKGTVISSTLLEKSVDEVMVLDGERAIVHSAYGGWLGTLDSGRTYKKLPRDGRPRVLKGQVWVGRAKLTSNLLGIDTAAPSPPPSDESEGDWDENYTAALVARGIDPLAELARGGIDMGDGRALISGKTGMYVAGLEDGQPLRELVRTPESGARPGCEARRAGRRVFALCTIDAIGSEGGALLFEVAGGGERLRLEGPLLFGMTGVLVASSAGGVGVSGACRPDRSDAIVCALQPNGSFRPVREAESGAQRMGAIPLVDGRAAYLSKELDDDAHTRVQETDVARFRVVVADATGAVQKLPAIDVPDPSGAAHAAWDLDQIDSRIISFSLFDDAGAVLVEQDLVSGTSTARRLSGGRFAKRRGSRVVAYGPSGIRVSQDGGHRWDVLEPPSDLSPRMTEVPDAEGTSPTLELSDAGFTIFNWVRVGYGPGTLPPATSPSARASAPLVHSPAVTPNSPVSPVCKTTARAVYTQFAAGPGFQTDAADVLLGPTVPKRPDLFGRHVFPLKYQRSAPPGAGFVLEYVAAPASRPRHFPRPVGSFRGGRGAPPMIPRHVEPPADAPPAAAKLRARWIDGSHVGAQAFEWTGVWPAATSDAASVPSRPSKYRSSFPMSPGSLSLYELVTGNREALMSVDYARMQFVRFTAAGPLERVTLPPPVGSTRMELGEKPGLPAAILRGNTVWLWPPLRDPEPVAYLPVASRAHISRPNAASLAVAYQGAGWAAHAVVANKPSGLVPVTLTHDAFSEGPSLESAATSAPACTKDSPGHEFVVQQTMVIRVDGAPHGGPGVVVVRLSGARACRVRSAVFATSGVFVRVDHVTGQGETANVQSNGRVTGSKYLDCELR